MPSQRFQYVNRRAFVGQRGQKRPTPTVTAGTLQPRTRVQQGKRLGQAVGVEPSADAFLTGKEWTAAVHAPGLCSRDRLA